MRRSGQVIEAASGRLFLFVEPQKPFKLLGMPSHVQE
jgi:hypothetical protein